MSGIVCALRGGPESQPTVATAVALAQRSGLPLYFLYVVNLDFLTYTSSSRVHTISEDLRQMGEFILLQAQSVAQANGVDAQTFVRDGNVMEEVTAMCRELKADYLVLGQPRVQEEKSIFTTEQLSQFKARVEEQIGARVVLAERGQP